MDSRKAKKKEPTPSCVNFSINFCDLKFAWLCLHRSFDLWTNHPYKRHPWFGDIQNPPLPDGVYIEVWTSGPTIYIKRHPCLGTFNINWFRTYWATFCWLQGTIWANPLHKGHPCFGDIQKSVTPIHIVLKIVFFVTFGGNIKILVKNLDFGHFWWKQICFAWGFYENRHFGKKS